MIKLVEQNILKMALLDQFEPFLKVITVSIQQFRRFYPKTETSDLCDCGREIHPYFEWMKRVYPFMSEWMHVRAFNSEEVKCFHRYISFIMDTEKIYIYLYIRLFPCQIAQGKTTTSPILLKITEHVRIAVNR